MSPLKITSRRSVAGSGAYRTLRDCIIDLEESGQLVRIPTPLKAREEIAAVQRRAVRKGGPALLFTTVLNPDGRATFPMLGNLFGTMERTRYIFRSSLGALETVFKLTADPGAFFKEAARHPADFFKLLGLPRLLWHALPKKTAKPSRAPVTESVCKLSDLPQLKSWPKDGGGYVTLPQVYTEDPARPGFFTSNTGMYRVQLSGGSYLPDAEAGLHYQIHRGIGYHHAAAIARGERLKVNIFIGGPPAMSMAAIMPLPDGMPEICFAGALGGRRVRMFLPPMQYGRPLPIAAEADFCICGTVGGDNSQAELKPEGPFGDHLGYYSLAHDFPLLKVERVMHRRDAVWPFTTVGRPPQEDSVIGRFIHELTGAMIPKVFSGVHEVNAVDAAGVHPLLLAIGSERYVPFSPERQPQELLTRGLSLLGSTQTSLAKYLLIAAREDAPALTTQNIPDFFAHMLERTDFSRDLHFITRTTLDTLDYTGISLNQGSKLIWAAAGRPLRTLARSLDSTPVASWPLPSSFSAPRLFAPGIVVCQGPPHTLPRDTADPAIEALSQTLRPASAVPLLIVSSDADFTCADWDNFLWTVFTRSDPATDLYGLNSATHNKHWGCETLVIDARAKTFHAPPLEEDPAVASKIEALAAKGGPLHGII